MVHSNVIVDIIYCHLFVFSQLRAKVSAGLTNVKGLALAAFALLYCSLFICPGLSEAIKLVLTLKMTTY